MKLAELTWPDLEQVSRDTVVIYPIAAFEQHGPHLPFITDTAEVQAIVDRKQHGQRRFRQDRDRQRAWRQYRLQKDGHPPRGELAAQVARYRWMHESTDRGVYGDPTFGTAEKGERFLSAAVEVLVRIVGEIRQGEL